MKVALAFVGGALVGASVWHFLRVEDTCCRFLRTEIEKKISSKLEELKERISS